MARLLRIDINLDHPNAGENVAEDLCRILRTMSAQAAEGGLDDLDGGGVNDITGNAVATAVVVDAPFPSVNVEERRRELGRR
jgi:hypothetical protein